MAVGKVSDDEAGSIKIGTKPFEAARAAQGGHHLVFRTDFVVRLPDLEEPVDAPDPRLLENVLPACVGKCLRFLQDDYDQLGSVCRRDRLLRRRLCRSAD